MAEFNYAIRNNGGQLTATFGWYLQMLMLYADSSLRCYPSNDKLCEDMGITEPTLIDAKDWLIERGVIVLVPHEKRPEYMKKRLHHRKHVYQITGIMYLEHENGYRVIPTVHFKIPEQMESIKGQLEDLDFFSQISMTEDMYCWDFFRRSTDELILDSIGINSSKSYTKNSLGKDSLPKNSLPEVYPDSKVYPEATDTNVSVGQDALPEPQLTVVKKGKPQLPKAKSSIDSLPPVGGAKKIATPRRDPPKNTRKGKQSENQEQYEEWILALLWTMNAERRWRGFNAKTQHSGLGQQVKEAKIIWEVWKGFVEDNPDTDELCDLEPMDIMKDMWGEKWDKRNGWLFTEFGLDGKELTISTAVVSRHFNAYISHPKSKPYKLTKGVEVEKEKILEASQAVANDSLYGKSKADDPIRQKIAEKYKRKES